MKVGVDPFGIGIGHDLDDAMGSIPAPMQVIPDSPQVIANQTQSHFETLSAVLDGKPRLREVVNEALERRRLYGKRSILFVK